jgi:hypothetical protein
MDVIAILNTIRDNSSSLYAERVPEATKDNIQEVGNAIMEYESVTNEFLNALVNRIAFTIVSNRRFKNPLAVLKKGGKPFGTDIEEIYTNPVSAVSFNGSATDDMLKVTKPDTKTMFHRMNRQDKYPVSISTPQLQKAFLSADEMGKFVTSIINAMYSGDEMDEYLLMRNTISEAITDNKLEFLEVEYDGEETASKGLVKLVKTLAGNFLFPSKDYNGYNKLNAAGISVGTITPSVTWTPSENQIFLVRTDVDAATDVEVLAKAFNMDKTDFLKRKFVVDSFGDNDTLCVICDENIFEIRDDLYQVRSFDNGSNLTTNYWLHHWQTISLSLFGNAVAIRQKTV